MRSRRDAGILEPDVPAGTLRTFARGGRNLQQTHDPGIGEQTLLLWRGARP
jgi:hypothetical protein